MPIPSDAHVPGDTGHVTDHNNIVDTLTALTAGAATETTRATAAEALALPKTGGTITGDLVIGGGSPWYDVVAFGADPTGVSDSTAAFNAAILAATGAASPATTGRTATGPVYMPPGTYKISSDLLIQSVLGFQLIGAGAECTFVKPSGTGFTTAVINIDGSYHGHYGGFTVKGDGTEQVPNVINLTWTTAAQRSTTANHLENINIRNTNFVTGISLAGVGTRQIDGTLLTDIVVSGSQPPGAWSTSGNWQYGIVYGNGSFGNIYDQVARGTTVASCYYGVYCNASSFALYGSQPNSNAVDFFVIPSAQCTLSNITSQNSGQFLTQTSAFSPQPVSVSDVKFTSTYVTTPNVIDVYGGLWDIRNFVATSYSSSGSAVAPVINIRGAATNRPGIVSLINVTLSSTFPAGVGASSQARISVTNYAYFDPTASNYTVTPWSYWNGTAWITQATATGVQAPTLTATGLTGATAAARLVGGTASGAPVTGTFTAGDTSVDQTGALWVCTVAGTPGTWAASGSTPPNIQYFTASGTWTKPAGAQAVDVTVLPSTAGGGSGASGTGTTVISGGAGAGAGVLMRRTYVASDLASTVTVTIPAGGAGGASVTGMTPRTDTCGTNSTTTVTDTSCIAGDAGRSVTGTGMPANVSITAVNPGVSFTLSAAATATNASVSLTIGNTTFGLPGTAPAATSFGTSLYSSTSPAAGGGGSTATAAAGSGPLGGAGTGGAGAAGSAGAAGTGVNASFLGGIGGSSGGGISAASAAFNGAAGSRGGYFDLGSTAGAAGVVGGASPTSGVMIAGISNGNTGPSPGSGAASVTGAAQTGASALANSGAGGSGGGASLNGNPSGAGGNGGTGWVLVITHFA